MSIIKNMLYGMMVLLSGLAVFMSIMAFSHLYPVASAIILFAIIAWVFGVFGKAIDEREKENRD